MQNLLLEKVEFKVKKTGYGHVAEASLPHGRLLRKVQWPSSVGQIPTGFDALQEWF